MRPQRSSKFVSGFGELLGEWLSVGLSHQEDFDSERTTVRGIWRQGVALVWELTAKDREL